jgi:hypothetical protein
MRGRVFQEIMEQAIANMREALGQEIEEAEAEQWDPDAWEQVVRQFTQQLGQQLLQIWAEVRTEQAEAQSHFVLAPEGDVSGTAGSPSGG